MTTQHLLAQVADLMTIAERTIALGSGRKEYVLHELKKMLGDSEFEKNRPFIEFTIETIILISHSEIDIRKINSKSLCCCK